jgi:hypothetical protein
MLDGALKALKTLKTKDFVTLKSYNNPPYLIRLALEGACVMLGVSPKMEDVGEGKNKTKVPNYWGKAKKLLSDYKKFLHSLEKYQKDNIP